MTEPTVSPLPARDLCGTMLVHRRMLNESMSYRSQRAVIENRALQYEIGRLSSARRGPVVIPVVVHVVAGRDHPEQNIDDEQVHSQITVLNQDFRAANPDVSKVPGVWRDLVADTQIEFRLATRDPNGEPTDGIVRVVTDRPGFDHRDGVKSSRTGGADPWPSDRYLNMWVCQLAGSLLGYATFPGQPPHLDGVVIGHSFFGTTGTAAAPGNPFNRGRTTTHEIGHWLNLFHIWGDDDGACSSDDKVADTPNQADANTGMPTFPHVTCANGPNGDMFMNYMDYTDDAGMFMFTQGQLARMNACLEGARASFLAAMPVPEAEAVRADGSRHADAGEEARGVPDGEVERLLHDSERLTTEALHDIRAALNTVAGYSRW
ncbi:zinc metalloprotease [Planobispora rosea]|uniref:zinc metalloprotease n=1 Tax=Planobispora rosea TaxID=35762 RepID=UPI00083B0C3C|nr:zinc metalloprotease [Planobispora rosea]